MRKPPPPRRSCTDGSVSDTHSDILSSESMIHIRSRPYYFRRCKNGMPTNIESLPTELLFEILLRLPADHLYERARLVSRRWYHIIHSHAFISAQMHSATYGLLLWPLKYNTLPLYVTAEADGGIQTSELNHISKLRACCNGLALELVAKDDYIPRLVNPATKQSFLLPPLPRTRGVYYRQNYCSLAYSAASLAYKVIVPCVQTGLIGLVVHTVGVDESWRHVEVHHLPNHVRRFFFDNAPLTTEGFFHWGSGKCCAIMDVETEIITLSEAPYEYNEHDYYYLSTGRCLSLLVACGDLSWEVWEMKAETGEWKKMLPNVDLGAQKCRIQQFAPEAWLILKPLGWVKYPQVLAFNFTRKVKCCILYNLDTHQLDSIELPEPSDWYKAFQHKNNLMWLR